MGSPSAFPTADQSPTHLLADNKIVALPGLPNVLIYGDDSLPTLFYCTSTVPSVARAADGTYLLTLVHYDKPTANFAGLLSLTIDLRPTPADLAETHRQLAALHPGQAIQCVPFPWTAGTLAAALIGGVPVAATPSLLGENEAVLSLPLTTDQYILLRNAKRTGAAPLSVVYGLTYQAFRPEYKFSVIFDTNKFRDWLQSSCTANVLFVSFEKTETYEKLTTAGVIRISSENYTGETPPDGFREAFLASIQSILVPLPAFAPAPQAQSGGDWLLGYSCSSVHDIQDISRHLDTNMQIAGVVARQAFLQGSLAGLDEALATRPDLEFGTGFSFNQILLFRVHDSFEGRPLDAVRIDVLPSGNPQTTRRFQAPTDEWTLDLVRDPRNPIAFTYQCTLYFRDGKPSITTAPTPIPPDVAYIDILPSTLYTFRLHTITVAGAFPWALVNRVTVSLSGPPSFSFKPATVSLTKAAPIATLEAFAPTVADLDALIFTAVYTPALGQPFSLQGFPSGASIYLNPFLRRTVTFRVAPGFNWTAVPQVRIAIDFDPANPILYANGKLVLTSTIPSVQFPYWFANTRSLRYKVTFGSAPTSTRESTQTDILLNL